MGCGRDCDCESEEAHDAAVEASLEDFLRDPGPPPAHMSPEGVARARKAMDEARRKRNIP